MNSQGNTTGPSITAIASGKGGVGKTFLTANLACCLVKTGKKVLVVDCDLGLANMDILLGLSPGLTLQDVIFEERDINDVIIPTSAGFDFLPASSGVKEMGQLIYEKLQTIKETINTVVPKYDNVLLDTGAGISEVVLQFNLFAPKNVIVLNKEPTSMTDAYAVIKVMHQRFQTKSFGIVINSVENENEAHRLFEHMDQVCKNFLSLPLYYLGHIIKHDTISRSIINQRILVQEVPDCIVGHNCRNIAEAITNWKP